MLGILLRAVGAEGVAVPAGGQVIALEVEVPQELGGDVDGVGHGGVVVLVVNQLLLALVDGSLRGSDGSGELVGSAVEVGEHGELLSHVGTNLLGLNEQRTQLVGQEVASHTVGVGRVGIAGGESLVGVGGHGTPVDADAGLIGSHHAQHAAVLLTFVGAHPSEVLAFILVGQVGDERHILETHEIAHEGERPRVVGLGGMVYPCRTAIVGEEVVRTSDISTVGVAEVVPQLVGAFGSIFLHAGLHPEGIAESTDAGLRVPRVTTGKEHLCARVVEIILSGIVSERGELQALRLGDDPLALRHLSLCSTGHSQPERAQNE